MTKKQRIKVYEKYNGHCAYCGKVIEYKDMQVDHIVPQRAFVDKKEADQYKNLNPSCRRCNHYKRGSSLNGFRELLKGLNKRVRDFYICKVAEDYGIITVKQWDGKFYFENKGADEIERLKAEHEKRAFTFCPKCNRLTEYDSHFDRRVCTNAKCNWRGAKGAK